MGTLTRLPVKNTEKTGERGPPRGRNRGSADAHKGRWQKGISGNPRGRPQGSRNRDHMWLQDLLLDGAERVVSRVMKAALDGDMTAARLVLERILPKNSRPLCAITLPPLSTAADACTALSAIAAAVSDARISASEAAELSIVVEGFRKALDTNVLEERIASIEERIAEQARE